MAIQPQPFGESRGFSLLEMLVAVAILAVGTLSVATLQRTAVKGNLSAFSGQTAVGLAAQLFEEAAALKYKDPRLAATSGYVAPASTLSPANPLDAGGQTATVGYTRTWQITDNPTINGAAANNVKRIAVRVAWNQAGQAQQITISTIKAK